MRCDLEGSLARSKWWRRAVEGEGVEVVAVAAAGAEDDLRASSSSSLSSTFNSILLGFLLSISETLSSPRLRFTASLLSNVPSTHIFILHHYFSV